MAYLHCHKCGWSQDDFWNKSYNAIRFLLNWEDELLNEKFKQKFPGDSEWRKRFGDITYQEVIAQELERHAQTIRNMVWVTRDEFQADYDAGKAKCPKCGSSKYFDID
jgi:predicted RNA-binding Zn-ribbon protein involved in translation (DUF1610 family)